MTNYVIAVGATVTAIGAVLGGLFYIVNLIIDKKLSDFKTEYTKDFSDFKTEYTKAFSDLELKLTQLIQQK
ncbi:MAG: hypothetical protein AAGF26_15465 [Cyanobacteria bacterium P01_G01_bin.49]